MLLVWTSAPVAGCAANLTHFDCEDVTEYFEDELTEDTCKGFLELLWRSSSVSETEPVCFMRFFRTIELSNTDPSFGWMMPLRI